MIFSVQGFLLLDIWCLQLMCLELQGHRTPSQYKDSLSKFGIPMLKIRLLQDRLIFNTGISILVRWQLDIETAPKLIKNMPFYQYSKSHYKDKMVMGLSLSLQWRLSISVLKASHQYCWSKCAFKGPVSHAEGMRVQQGFLRSQHG